jgi:glycosyltransferase involved in cell wall biosynthesis
MRIDVCIASYRGALFIEEQIDSILTQLQPGDRLIIADDGSTDGTLDIIRRYGNQVMLVSGERVGGVVPNFERVLSASDADATVLADQDDVWLSGRLDYVRTALLTADLVILNGEIVDQELISLNRTIFSAIGVRHGFLANLKQNAFVGCCMAFRRGVRERVLPFPPGIPWHDWYIGLVAELTGTVARVDAVTMLYRRHGANFSPTGEASTNSLWRKIVMRLRVLFGVLIAVYLRRRTE